MTLERSELTVKPGTGTDFVAVMRTQANALLLSVPGCTAVEVGQGVEHPDKILILVEWDSLAAHGEFHKRPAYAEFRALIGPFVLTGAMEHFDMA